MKLIQIHHQFADGHTEFQEQFEINNNDDLKKAWDEIQKTHPLPENASNWMACEEGHPSFVMTTKKED